MADAICFDSRMEEKLTDYRSGLVALIGRPNAGKSTLLNCLVGQKIAAVSNKPQTTRHSIQGIITRPEGQIVFVDTPGVHKPGHLLNRRMMSTVQDALFSVDIVVLIRDASVSTGNGDQFVIDLVKRSEKPSILLLNKIDRVKNKSALLPLIKWYSEQYEWRAVVPVSALRGQKIDELIGELFINLPLGEKLFAEDEMTDQPIGQIAAEMVREKILRITGDEIPYVTAVRTELYEREREDLTRICCVIYVERPSQKGIIIGKKGERLKIIGTEARHELERLTEQKIFLELFVKVAVGWRDNATALDEMGI